MLKVTQVQEVLARLERREAVVAVARALAIDLKAVRAWRRRGTWQARRPRARHLRLDRLADWHWARTPEAEPQLRGASARAARAWLPGRAQSGNLLGCDAALVLLRNADDLFVAYSFGLWDGGSFSLRPLGPSGSILAGSQGKRQARVASAE